MNESEEIKKAIECTVAYFDIFDYPLTSLEVWKYLYGFGQERSAVSFWSVEKNLFEMQGNTLGSKNGFYFLQNRQNIYHTRTARSSESLDKFKKAKKIIKVLSWMPYVRTVCVINTLSYNNAKEQSDIDIFILGKAGRLWTSRFFTVGFLKLFKLRPTEMKRKDAICLNMLADPFFEMEGVQKSGFDIHFAHILSAAVPMYNQNGSYEKFWNSNIFWMKKYFPNIYKYIPSENRAVDDRKVKIWFKKITEYVATEKVEKILERIQLAVLPAEIKNASNKGDNVVLSKSLLKFHVNDRREEYNKKFLQKTEKLSLPSR